MDIQTIEDEIYNFDSDFFKDILVIAEDGVDFIENNKLHMPKENYTILFDYLNPLYNHFKSLDYQAIGSTLAKLYMDVKYLNHTYKDLQYATKDVKEIFEKKVIKESQLLLSMEKEVNRYKNIVNISKDDNKILKKHTNSLAQLKKIYFNSFERSFREDKNYVFSGILKTLNTKTYYLEKLLWLEVSQSEILLNSLKEIQVDKEFIDSKIYITYKLSVIMPYSEDYKYLQKCLRIFK